MGVPQNIWFIGGNPNLKWMIRGYPYIYILYISIHIPHNEEEKPLGPHFFFISTTSTKLLSTIFGYIDPPSPVIHIYIYIYIIDELSSMAHRNNSRHEQILGPGWPWATGDESFRKGKKTMVEVLKPTIFKFFWWMIYGWHMDDIWIIYGWYMNNIWMIYGWYFPWEDLMDDIWIIYGSWLIATLY